MRKFFKHLVFVCEQHKNFTTAPPSEKKGGKQKNGRLKQKGYILSIRRNFQLKFGQPKSEYLPHVEKEPIHALQNRVLQ